MTRRSTTHFKTLLVFYQSSEKARESRPPGRSNPRWRGFEIGSSQLKDNLAFNSIRSVRFHYHRFLGFLAIVSSGIRSRGPVDAIGRPIVQMFPGSFIYCNRSPRWSSYAAGDKSCSRAAEVGSREGAGWLRSAASHASST
jgi:hypothetical protein